MVRAQSPCDSVLTSVLAGPSISWPIAAPSRSPLRLVRAISWARVSSKSRSSISSGLVEHGGDPRVLALRRQRLVGDQLGLHDQAQRLVDRLDLVPDRGDRALGERDQAGAVYADPPPGRRLPLQLPVEGAGAEVEHPGVRDQFAVADVEGLVVDQQPDRLAVGHVDHGLPRLGEAVAGLGVRQRPQLVERVQIGARDAVRLALVEVAAQADVPVAECEDRLRLGEDLEVEAGLADMPRLDRVRALADHESSSLRSRTTTVAPLSLRPCA